MHEEFPHLLPARDKRWLPFFSSEIVMHFSSCYYVFANKQSRAVDGVMTHGAMQKPETQSPGVTRATSYKDCRGFPPAPPTATGPFIS